MCSAAWWHGSAHRLRAWRGADPAKIRLGVELCATYWHFLLAVWVVLYALLVSDDVGLAICSSACPCDRDQEPTHDDARSNRHTAALPRPDGWQSVVADVSSDQRAFKDVPWGKPMMWIFLLSDTFIFGSFLISYMTVRMSTTVPWPNPSEVFSLQMFGRDVPLLLIAIMTFVLISSSGTMALAVNFGYRRDRKTTFILLVADSASWAPPSSGCRRSSGPS